MDATPSGKSLAERIKAGDAAAEEELISTYRRGILAIARVRIRNLEAAKDITQDVFTEALKALREGKLREPDKLTAFLEGIAHNVINSLVRKERRRSECPLDDTELASGDPVKELEFADRQRRVRREIDALNLVDQQILVGSFVECLPLAEIAEKLGMSHNSVRTRKSRAIKRLKKKFSGM